MSLLSTPRTPDQPMKKTKSILKPHRSTPSLRRHYRPPESPDKGFYSHPAATVNSNTRFLLPSSVSPPTPRNATFHSRKPIPLVWNSPPSRSPSTPSRRPIDLIPPEILQLILTYLYMERETLHSCTLVSKTWLTPSRNVLFHPSSDPKHLTARISPTSAHDLYDLLQNPHATVHNHIRTLVVHTQETFSDPFFTLTKGYRKTWLSGPPKLHIHGILSKLTSSSSLRCLKLNLGNAQTDPIVPIIASLEHLVELELRSAAFSTFWSLVSVICSETVRKTLVFLSLTDVTWKKGPEECDESPADREWVVPERLTRLHLFTRKQAEFVRWLLGAPTMAGTKSVQRANGSDRSLVQGGSLGIRTLWVGGLVCEKDEEAIKDLLERLGPELRHLKVYARNWIRGVDLGHNTHLQSLSISHYLMDTSPSPSSTPPLSTSSSSSNSSNSSSASSSSLSPSETQLISILHSITSHTLTKFSFQFILRDVAALDQIDWPAIEDALVVRKFARLRAVQIRAPGEQRVVGMLLREFLPRLGAWGVLFVRGDGGEEI